MLEPEKNAYYAWPPGHYYSPIPNLNEVIENKERIFSQADSIPGVHLNDRGQLRLFDRLSRHYHELPFTPEKTEQYRYYYNNGYYSYGDAILFFCMIRHLKPQRIIEIGSGFSSAISLDVNEQFFDSRIRCTFIEPYPDRLLSLIKDDDIANITLYKNKLNEVDPKIFGALSKNDILFVDSTHVSKIDSDVNRILFEILPILKPGVYIHFHDIFHPFEYPLSWLLEGRFWTEAYLLRAFLQYNRKFEVQLYSTYFYGKYGKLVSERMPLYEKCRAGHIWIKKKGFIFP
ncbi:MAG TPA: class I SAM-dependent methyltransferase [Methanocella sp.]|nr:class I SAM-dependent methyltransferase [Methanocella sp.]